ncbi:MAG TPA: hypothetical protein PLK76_01790 [bacterium]|nr:hypothetical protein [bacterium]
MDYLKKIFTKKNVLIILAVVLTGGSFFLAKNVLAVDDNYDGVATMVVWLTSWLVHILVYVFGQLLLIAISILIKVCSFNEFVEADIVTTGWVIIRDLANLGIVIMMLVIAFGTTLNKNAYKYQTMLPKLLVSAILINFSKEITGLLISLSQYLMMYFVHAFENIAAGNITYGLGIDDMLSVRKAVRSAGGGAEINDWNVLGALIMGMVMLAVALGVVLTMALMLLRRIVAFWMLLIMSPIYFVADLIPPAKEYASQWKKELTDNLVKGPTLAFMFWLSMTVLSKITDQNRIINLQMQSEKAASGGALSTTDYAFFASKMSSPQRVFDYLITIILFLFTMSLAKKAGGMAGKFAGAYSGRLEKVGKWFQKKGSNMVTGTVKAPFKAAGFGINAGLRRIPTTAPVVGLVGAMARDSYRKKQKEKLDKRISRLKKMGLGGEQSAEWLANNLPNGGRNRLIRGANGVLFNRTRRAAERISANSRASRAMAGQYNNNAVGGGGVTGGRSAWEMTSPGGIYSTSEGIRGTFRGALSQLNNDAVSNLRAAGTAGNIDQDLTLALQRALASYRHGGGNFNAVLNDLESAVDTIATGHSLPATSTIGPDQVVYSRTNMNNLIQHDATKKAFEEFKLRPENQGLGEEELKQKFFTSDGARQAYRQGNGDARRFVNEAVTQGVNTSQLGELGVQNLSVQSGQAQFQEPTEMPSPEQLRATFERTEEEIRRLAEATHEGVTVGQYGRREGENILAVGFDELNEYMNRNNLGHITGLEDGTSEGVMIENVEQVRQGLAGMIGEQLTTLRNATTNEEKVEALKSFGIQTDANNKNLDNLINRADAKATAALNKLEKEKDLVNDEGLVLVNKNRVSGTAREVIRHEEAHDMMSHNDEDGEIRRDLADSLSQEMRTRIDSHLQGRSDYNQLDGTQRLEEYAADVMGRRVQDPEFVQLLADSGLLNRTGGVPGGEAISTINVQGINVAPEVQGMIDNSVLENIRNILEQHQSTQEIQLENQVDTATKNEEEWKQIRKSIESLSVELGKTGTNLGAMSENVKSGFNQARQQIDYLNQILPKVNATPLERKAAMEQAKLSNQQLKAILKGFVAK